MTHQGQTGGPELPVVVGVDGSAPSKGALAWAAEYARTTGRPLTVVLTWHYPTEYGWALPLPNDWNPAGDAQRTLDEEVANVLGTTTPVPVTTKVVEGQAQQVLVEASTAAAVVVVASRGLGQFTGMLLGSVSEYLTAHAHCPVVVVRDRPNVDASGAHGDGRSATRKEDRLVTP
jgi:nucleotide-binding universal stress UspA family protein